MNSFVFIIQSEGKGHFSQALEAKRMLESNGKRVTAVFIGRRPFQKLPDYFTEALEDGFSTFPSPGFLPSGSRKGIHLGRTIFLNLLLVPLYLAAAYRLRAAIRRSRTEGVLNFYDPVGAVACKRAGRKRKVISVSHHFYLSHPDFFSPRGFGIQPYLLGFMNNYFIRHSDRVLALSFRKAAAFNKISVIPPLISGEIRKLERNPGNDDLCYLLHEGFLAEITDIYLRHEQARLHIFMPGTGIMKLAGTGQVSVEDKARRERIRISPVSRQAFRERLTTARRLICTAGFDAVAEAFFLRIPVFLLPAENHFEQYCNALDASRTGMAFHLDAMEDLKHAEFEPYGHNRFRKWVDAAEPLFLNELEK